MRQPIFKMPWPGLQAFFAWILIAYPIMAQGREGAFTLESERGRFLLGEPVYLRIGSRTIVPPALEEGTMVLSIRGPDGGEWEYHPPLRFRSNSGRDSPAPIASFADSGKRLPAVRIRFARLIASDGDLVFKKPGKYSLRLKSPKASGADSSRLIISDTLALEFRLPTREPDRRAYGILSRDPGEYALAVYLEGGQQLRAGMAILKELAAFPNAYRGIARFVIASDLAQDFTDFKGGPSRPMDLEKAFELSEWSLESGLYVPLRTAYRLRNAAQIMAARDPSSAVPDKIRRKLAGFEASLTPRELALLRSF